MKGPRDSFPFEAARDLLGILRALYAADKARGKGPRRLRQISDLALDLRRAMDLATEHGPGTTAHHDAIRDAERATRRLADLVDVTTPLEPTLLAAGERLRRGGVPEGERDRRRRARNIRS
jgi:hypothetical protein